MRTIRRLLLASGAAALLASACATETPGSGEADATSCEDTYLDDGGRCRRSNGWFAPKVCCIPKTPTERRTLEAYSCPDGEAPVPVAFFDADSTLRVSRSGAPSANGPEDVYVLPFAAREIAKLNDAGYLVAVVSNQGGVAAGFIELETAEAALVFTIDRLQELGGKVDYLDFADQKDENRKPKTGMPERLEDLLEGKCDRGIDWEGSFMVGDAGYDKDEDGPHPDGRPADDFSNSDRGLAENLGIPFHEPTDYFDWRRYEVYNIHNKWDLHEILDAMADEIEQLEASDDDPERLEMLTDEWNDIRSVNGFE